MTRVARVTLSIIGLAVWARDDVAVVILSLPFAVAAPAAILAVVVSPIVIAFG